MCRCPTLTLTRSRNIIADFRTAAHPEPNRCEEAPRFGASLVEVWIYDQGWQTGTQQVDNLNCNTQHICTNMSDICQNSSKRVEPVQKDVNHRSTASSRHFSNPSKRRDWTFVVYIQVIFWLLSEGAVLTSVPALSGFRSVPALPLEAFWFLLFTCWRHISVYLCHRCFSESYSSVYGFYGMAPHLQHLLY